MVKYVYRAERPAVYFQAKYARNRWLEHVLSIRIPFDLIIGIPWSGLFSSDQRLLNVFDVFVTVLYRRLLAEKKSEPPGASLKT